MNLTALGALITEARLRRPPKILSDFCGRQYQPYYHLFYLLADAYKGVAVELGTERGRGSFAFVLGGCETYGIDHNPTAKANINLAGFSNFTFIQSASMPIPDQIKGLKIDFLHIDTEHSYGMANAEFEVYSPFLNSPAIVFFDDLHANDNSVLECFMELPYPKIQDDRLHPITGFGILLYE